MPDTGLVMQSFYLQDGGGAVFGQGVKKTFLMDIANTSNTAASNVQVKFELETIGGTPVLTKTSL